MRFEEIHVLEDFLHYWPFFLEGLLKCNETQQWEEQRQTPEVFFKRTSELLLLPADDRLILLAFEEGVPIGYIINFQTVKPFGRKCIFCIAAYAGRKNPSIVKRLMNYGERWARERGYEEIDALSANFNGSGFALFEKRWGFRRKAIIFSKLLK